MPAIAITKRDGTVLHAQVSPEDYAEAAAVRWHMAGGKGREGKYLHSAEYGYMHRWVAMRMGLIGTTEPERGMRGRWTESIDHDNGDKLDNQRGNLKLRNRPQQMSNLNDGPRSTNTHGHRGVTYAPGRKRPWNAHAMEAGRNINLGYFATAEDAAAARKSYDKAPDKEAWLAARRPRDAGASGIRGVGYTRGHYYARITENGEQLNFGFYETPEQALEARESYLTAPDKEAWLRLHRSAPQSNGTSGYRGVSFLKGVRARQWQAYANSGGKRFNLGRYGTAEEAAAARRAWDSDHAG